MKLLLQLLLLMISLTATISGAFMILYPGENEVDLLLADATRFPNSSIPGWILVAIGSVNLFALYQWWQKAGSRFTWSIVSGLLISAWIIAQAILTNLANLWQAGYLVAGVLVILAALQLKGKWVV